MVGRLVGREAELDRIAGAVVNARGGTSRCLLVTGEAGIGKSRLVAEAVGSLGDALVLTGHAADMTTGEIPFGVVADTLRDLVRVAGVDVLLPAERDALAPLLPGAAPRLQVERVQLLSTFLDLLERLACERLVVWVVEDLHWADSATRDLVGLAARTLPAGLLIVATVRTDDPERTPAAEAALTSYVAGLARTPGCEVLPLSRLGSDAVQRQLRDLLGSRPSAEVASRVERLSDGIPFVVEELVAAAGRPELTTAAAVAAGRLGTLTPETRRLVEAAAVGDGHLRISLLEQVLDVTPEELDTALVEALRAGILTTDHEHDAVGFRHALLREATSRETGPGARRAWHRRWAEVLEDNPGVLAGDPALLAVAEHWHQARDVRRSLAAAVAALPSAERIADPHRETLLWRRVLSAWASLRDPEAVAGLTLREVVAQSVLAAQSTGMASFLAVLDAVPVHLLDESERATLAVIRAITGEAKGDIDPRFREMTQDLFDRFDLFSGPRDLFSLLALSLALRLPASDERSVTGMDAAADIAAELASPRGRVEHVVLRSHSRQFRGDPHGAADYLEEQLAQLRDLPGHYVLFADGNVVWCRSVCGEHRRAQEIGEAALAQLRHPELSVGLWEHLVENHAFSLTCTGDWARARQLLEESAPWWEDDLRTSNARLALLDVAQRGATDASRWTSLSREVVPSGAHPVIVRHLVAAASAASGDLAAARSEYRALWADDGSFVADDCLWCVLRDAARAEADAATNNPDRDDRDEASVHMDEIAAAVERCRRYGRLGEVWPLDLAAQLDRFHGRDARPALREALAGWERIGHVPDVAVTHLSLAEQEAVHGDRDAARRHLAAGREVAERLEAAPLLARADALAERWAIGPRERRTDGVLTEREVEVLRLVAEGMTNGQIGTTLFMSPKTASVHVSHILAKLGAANRTEAAATARRQGLLG
ncbi:AAA family ATPase [Nocardioides cavernae]|uniref:AAA family ATPase n=1 Tax=Nocardioides cavernae TaxID=1921566 RepID=A0ABR8N7K5_9ACTN|nr:helix-turn-helix transcriptional regulator [Nocardioides cavernae]MBD3923542.1 AAA family ATPase [Nocardioides cavernae]MBM7511529.1 DNA-binding CsgD family transcriptional regulator [Nocardioides cavernae]